MKPKITVGEKGKLWSVPYLFLILLGTVTSTCFYLVNPTITKYAMGLGAPVALSGVIAGLFSITSLVVRPFSGLLADRISHKSLLLFATAVMGIAALGYSFSVSVPMLIVFRIMHGIAFSFSGTVNIVMIAELVPRERLGEGVGYYGLVNVFATAVGPALGLSLGNAFGYNISYLISGICMLTSTGLVLLLPLAKSKERMEKTKRGTGVRLNQLISPKILPLALLSCLFSLGNGIIGTYITLLGDVRGISNIGLYFTVNAAALLLVRPLAGKLSDRRGGFLLVLPALMVDGLALLCLGKAESILLICIAAVCKALAQGSGQPTLQAASLRKLPPEKSGVASSTFYIGGDIGQGLGPMLAGTAIGMLGSDSTGYGSMFYGAAMLPLLGGLGFLLYLLLKRGTASADSAKTAGQDP